MFFSLKHDGKLVLAKCTLQEAQDYIYKKYANSYEHALKYGGYSLEPYVD